MRNIKSVELIPFPDSDIQQNFTFDAIAEEGSFSFKFRWFSERWNCWVTTPEGDIRQIGVYPNVISGSGHLDYGFVFITDMTAIDYSSLF